MSLVLHEAVHLGGAGEIEARQWQEDFEHYFGIRFGDISKGSVEHDTDLAIVNARDFLHQAIDVAAVNPSDPRIYAFVGLFENQVANLPDVFDPLALELKLKPAHPELIGNYSNAVLALREKVKFKFETSMQLIHAKGMTFPIVPMSPALVVDALADMDKNLTAVQGNFKAFLDDSQAPYSDCILPEGKIDPQNYIGSNDHLTMYLPARKCQTLEMKPVDVQTR